MTNRFEIRKLTEIALLIAIAFVLDLIASIIPSPFLYGGSISLAMLPIFVIGLRYDWKVGLLSGLALGFLSTLNNPYIIHPIQYLLDYPIAYGVVGLSGVFKDQTNRLGRFLAGIVLGSFLRYLAHGFSGIIFFSEYALMEGKDPWVYSFILYNLPYMAASMAFCLIVGSILWQRKLFQKNLH